MEKNKIDALFADCHSNLETPLMGRIFTPTCYRCKNLIHPDNPFLDCTCKVFGQLPEKYWGDDKEPCPHKESE